MAGKDEKIRTSYQKKVDELEQKNNNLKKKIAEYQQKGDGSWQSFKSEFTHDLDKLGQALKDFTVNNKN